MMTRYYEQNRNYIVIMVMIRTVYHHKDSQKYHQYTTISYIIIKI